MLRVGQHKHFTHIHNSNDFMWVIMIPSERTGRNEPYRNYLRAAMS